MATTQPRCNRNDRPDDDQREGDRTPPVLVESGEPVCALTARPEEAQHDEDESHRESDATHLERIVGPLTSGCWRTRRCGAGTLASFRCTHREVSRGSSPTGSQWRRRVVDRWNLTRSTRSVAGTGCASWRNDADFIAGTGTSPRGRGRRSASAARIKTAKHAQGRGRRSASAARIKTAKHAQASVRVGWSVRQGPLPG